MRVFLDTNVLVAAFATRGLCADVVRVVLAEHRLLASETVLSELSRALRHKIRLPDRSVRSVVAFLRQEATVVTSAVPVPVPTLRDPSDAAIVAEALAARADVLVTGDGDLLDVAASLPLHVASPRDFWRQMARARPD